MGMKTEALLLAEIEALTKRVEALEAAQTATPSMAQVAALERVIRGVITAELNLVGPHRYTRLNGPMDATGYYQTKRVPNDDVLGDDEPHEPSSR
nr:hypothetical protein [uncultured Brevundimonas sp.]